MGGGLEYRENIVKIKVGVKLKRECLSEQKDGDRRREKRMRKKKEAREGVGKIKIKAKETSEENGRDIKIRQMIKKHKK